MKLLDLKTGAPKIKSIVLATPYFPIAYHYSIIGEGELNFCVRDGNRCTPSSIVTKTIPFISTLGGQKTAASNIGFLPPITSQSKGSL